MEGLGVIAIARAALEFDELSNSRFDTDIRCEREVIRARNLEILRMTESLCQAFAATEDHVILTANDKYRDRDCSSF